MALRPGAPRGQRFPTTGTRSLPPPPPPIPSRAGTSFWVTMARRCAGDLPPQSKVLIGWIKLEDALHRLLGVGGVQRAEDVVRRFPQRRGAVLKGFLIPHLSACGNRPLRSQHAALLQRPAGRCSASSSFIHPMSTLDCGGKSPVHLRRPCHPETGPRPWRESDGVPVVETFCSSRGLGAQRPPPITDGNPFEKIPAIIESGREVVGRSPSTTILYRSSVRVPPFWCLITKQVGLALLPQSASSWNESQRKSLLSSGGIVN